MSPDQAPGGFVPTLPQAMLARPRAAPPPTAGMVRRGVFTVPELDLPGEEQPKVDTAAEALAAAEAAAAAARERALAAAHAAGWAEGEAAGRAAAAAAHAEARATAEAVALAAAAAALGQIAGAAGPRIDQATQAIARLLLAALDAALPAAAARLAPEVAVRLVAAVRPVLDQAGRITLTVAPGLSAAVSARLADPRVAVVEDAAFAPGDARAAWQDGMAEADLAERRAAIAAVLGSLGLAPMDTTGGETG